MKIGSISFDKQDQARSTCAYTIECHAPSVIFGEWEALSQEVQDWYGELHPKLPCEGTGNINLYCDGCPFAEIYEDDCTTGDF